MLLHRLGAAARARLQMSKRTSCLLGSPSGAPRVHGRGRDGSPGSCSLAPQVAAVSTTLVLPRSSRVSCGASADKVRLAREEDASDEDKVPRILRDQMLPLRRLYRQVVYSASACGLPRRLVVTTSPFSPLSRNLACIL